MHRTAAHCLLIVAFFATSSFAADELEAQKKKLIESAEKNAVEVKLDLPYAGNSNPKQAVDVYLPKKRTDDKPLPVVALIHGGGWVRGDRKGYAALAIQLARTGNYAAVAVGYRLTNESHWPEQIYDCKAAIRWIRGHAREFNLDPERIAVWGSSAGGHLSSLLGTSGGVKEIEGKLGEFPGESSRVSCVVNQCGPEDFTKPLMFDKEGKGIVKDDAVIGLLGGTYEEKHAEAVAASPITYVSADDPPFLNIQGTKDQRVDYKNALAIHAALQKAGVSSFLQPIEGGGHGSVGHPEAIERAKKFVDLHLRGVKSEIPTTPIPALPEKAK